MAIGAVAAVVLLVLGVVCAALQRLPRLVDTEELGEVRVYPAWLRQRGLVFLFSGADGWNAADAASARQLARAGNHVVAIDTARFLAAEGRASADCVYLPGILESYSRRQQQDAGTGDYAEPVLLGRGTGATLVYMSQLQAPALAFAAAVVLDPVPTLAMQRTFCDHPALRQDATGLVLRPEKPGDNVPLRVLLSDSATSQMRSFAGAIAGASLAPPERRATQYQLYREALERLAAEQPGDGIADLPLVEMRPAKPSVEVFAILYSGDGGWRDLDRTLAGVLADRGMPVVGVDVLRYYWRTRPPDAAAHDLARIIRHYQESWRRRRVVLIGFSFGANVLPFLYNRLPQELRDDVVLVSLLSPERTAAFAVDPSNWLGFESGKGKVPIGPELQRLPGKRVQCVYGEDEAADSLCTDSGSTGLRLLRKPGGHHFDEDYGRLADDVLAAIAASGQGSDAGTGR
jgi:type IV secretory pathway VirJ component